MNTRRSPPSQHGHHPGQPVRPESPSSKQATTNTTSTRRSPIDSPSTATQSLPSLRDHLHSYLPPAHSEGTASSSMAGTTAPGFASGYPFQPYGPASGPSHLAQPPQPGPGYSFAHQLPQHSQPLHYPPPPSHAYPPIPHGEDSEEDELMSGPGSERRKRYSSSFSGRAMGHEGGRDARMDDYERERGSGSGDLDIDAPPKKKRRRQALSCTECKRRKIKCDRSQPCAPCTRRGEQAKCQWHIVEPVEKYIPRHEFDELKSRVEYLENIILRAGGHHPLYATPQQPGYPPPSGPGYPPQSMNSPQAQHVPSALPPPPSSQSHLPHSSMPGVPGPVPQMTSGIHSLLSESSGPSKSPANRAHELERDRDLRHVRSSPAVGAFRERKDTTTAPHSSLPLPSIQPGTVDTLPRRTGHQHSLSGSSSSSLSLGQGSRRSPGDSLNTLKGRSKSPR